MLYRRGNFNGTWDDLICQALLEEREADIALSPGFRWGPTVLPGQDITREDILNATAMSYPEAYRTEMTGEMLHTILEDVADNLFNPDPYYQQGGDMVRVGGMGYRIDIGQPQGSRITEMTLLSTGRRHRRRANLHRRRMGQRERKAPMARRSGTCVESYMCGARHRVRGAQHLRAGVTGA